jgi:formyltetrahydrofolate deformylase (EC 3.5.1.10)
MHPAPDHFILRVSCPAVSGIVAAVTTYLAEHGCYISEMAQFDDEDNGRFFMRAVFRYNTASAVTRHNWKRASPMWPSVSPWTGACTAVPDHCACC